MTGGDVPNQARSLLRHTDRSLANSAFMDWRGMTRALVALNPVLAMVAEKPPVCFRVLPMPRE